jgi:hypothetical protein
MFEITEVKGIFKGTLLASANVVVPKWGKFFISKITVFEKNGGRWISFPSETYEKDGKRKYAARCGFVDAEMHKAFEKEFFKAFDEYVAKNPLQPPVQQQSFGFQNNQVNSYPSDEEIPF